MGGGHASTDGLHHSGDSPVHRLPPEAKIAATVLFVLAVVATPREAPWAFALHALVLAGIVAVAALPVRVIARRMTIELPFLGFAVFMPIVGGSPRVDLFGLALSKPGLWAAWNIVVKGTLGVIAAIALSATTPVQELLVGLDRLRVPRTLTAIAGFMVRYLDVIAGETSRMRIARASRGYDPRWLWQAGPIAASAGTLFVRSFERGERVHLAMQSRGFTGAMPQLHVHQPHRHAWMTVAIAPVAAFTVAVLARIA